jgi:hypothetical protein
MKIRKHFTIDEEVNDYIKKIAKKSNLSESNVVENILKEYMSNNIDISKQIETINKNTQILNEMFNCFILNNWRDTDIVVTTDITKSELLETSEKEIERRMLKEKVSKI